MTAYKVERATRESRAFAVILIAIVVALATLPYWGDSGTMRLISEMAYYLALAQLWNLLAGYAGLVSVGQQAFVGIGGYTLFYLSSQFGVHPLFALALAAPVCAVHVIADGAVGVSAARRLFCSWHLGAGGGAAALRQSDYAARRRFRHEPHTGDRTRDRARSGGTRNHRLLDFARDRGRGLRHRLPVAALESMGWR